MIPERCGARLCKSVAVFYENREVAKWHVTSVCVSASLQTLAFVSCKHPSPCHAMAELIIGAIGLVALESNVSYS